MPSNWRKVQGVSGSGHAQQHLQVPMFGADSVRSAVAERDHDYPDEEQKTNAMKALSHRGIQSRTPEFETAIRDTGLP